MFLSPWWCLGSTILSLEPIIVGFQLQSAACFERHSAWDSKAYQSVARLDMKSQLLLGIPKHIKALYVLIWNRNFYTFCTFFLSTWFLKQPEEKACITVEYPWTRIKAGTWLQRPGVISSPIISSFVGHGLMNGAVAPCYDWNLYERADGITACV